MAGTCLVGCINDYKCGQLRKSIVDSQDVLSPWVKIYFGGSENPAITVGNQSQPDFGNTAVIKSFQYGRSNGTEAEIEIIDEQGGSFQRFIDKLTKCMDKIDGTTDYGQVQMEWGWTSSNCLQTSMPNSQIIKSPKLTGILADVSVSFENGVVKFLCKIPDLMQAAFVSRMNENEGDDDQKISLKQAIKNLSQRGSPKFNVRYERIEPDGSTTEWDFLDPEPVATFGADGQNKLGIIQKWIQSYRTDQEKGIVPVWDDEKFELVLLEDPTGSCNEGAECGSRNIGTFIVNGGRCSPVLSFQPDLNFVAAFGNLSTAGNAGGANTAKVETKEERQTCEKQVPETGVSESIPTTQDGGMVYGSKDVVTQTNVSQIAQAKANGLYQSKAIEAELRIVGDPSLTNFVTVLGKTASIVVINPFHITGGSECGDWIARPACNEVLSNPNWLIKGVDHSIKEGSYVTTLKVMLPAPGVDLNSDFAFGGSKRGYRPPDVCSSNAGGA